MKTLFAGAALLLCMHALPARATFSIAACDADGSCGVAVATHNLAVGGSGVAWAQPRVGAVASQFETNPHYGPEGLRLMAAGTSPEQALKRLLAADGDYDDTTVAERQVGLVDAQGRQAQYTGATALASSWAGASGGPGFSVQGNGLAGAAVLDAMRDAYLASDKPLADRLLLALEAGEAAGGQRSGRMSARHRSARGQCRATDRRVAGDVRTAPGACDDDSCGAVGAAGTGIRRGCSTGSGLVTGAWLGSDLGAGRAAGNGARGCDARAGVSGGAALDQSGDGEDGAGRRAICWVEGGSRGGGMAVMEHFRASSSGLPSSAVMAVVHHRSDPGPGPPTPHPAPPSSATTAATRAASLPN